MAADASPPRGSDWPGRPLLRRSAAPLVAFLAVVVAGVAGFSAIGDVGVVSATFWLIDPTSIELHEWPSEGLARLAKGYAVLVRVGLVLAGLWIGETALTAAFGGRISAELRRMQEERTLATVDDHVVVCGYGIFGQTIAGSLADDRRVVAVESDPDQYERVREDDHLGVAGDARREETLREAGIERADAVVAAIDDSNANIQIAILARQLAPEVRVVVRVGDEIYESVARRAGADEVVIPEVTSGRQVSERL